MKRATQCRPRVMNSYNQSDKDAVIQNDNSNIQNDNGYDQNVNLTKRNKRCSKCDKCFQTNQNLNRHFAICKGVDSLTCHICFKKFNNRQAKNQHLNRLTKCQPIEVPSETVEEVNTRLMKELKLKDEEIKALKSGRPVIINNNNNSNNVTNIQYNNYDKPYTDHITNNVMKNIYETSQRDPALILNETVRRIYKNEKHPENNVIKMGEKTALSKVYKDGKEIWLPMDGVIQTVLSSTGEFCADRIRDCHEEGVIIGDRARYVWQLMEVLGTDDREDDCLNRSIYVQSIKSAFL